jgi:hypothetical protein
VVFWVIAPKSLLVVSTSISEEHAGFFFRVKVSRVRMLVGCIMGRTPLHVVENTILERF